MQIYDRTTTKNAISLLRGSEAAAQNNTVLMARLWSASRRGNVAFGKDEATALAGLYLLEDGKKEEYDESLRE